MRHLSTLVFIGLVQTTTLAQAQDTPLVPEKIGVVYYVQGNALSEVPRVTGKKRTATFITARSKLRMEIQGGTSGVTVDDAKPVFAVLLPGGDITKLSLYPLKLKGKNREAVVGTGGSIHGESAIGAVTLPLDFVKAGGDGFRVTPASALAPGQYALGFAGSNEFSCFTVP